MGKSKKAQQRILKDSNPTGAWILPTQTTKQSGMPMCFVIPKFHEHLACDGGHGEYEFGLAEPCDRYDLYQKAGMLRSGTCSISEALS